jgi:hypothetical protein
MTAEDPKDLVCLVADKNTEQSILTLLDRPEALAIRRVTFDILIHPEHDPGCLLRSPEFLRSFVKRFTHAIVVFDREGCGREADSRRTLELDLEKRLSRAGWRERAAAIVVDPEIDAWVWSDSPRVDAVLGWTGRDPDLRSWLRDHELLDPSSPKPGRPKEAVEKALQLVRKPRSSALYRQLAREVGLARCA